jgi:hypothetical protein
MVLGVAAPAPATPISFNFSGTSSASGGSPTQFSGTFSYDSDVPLFSAAQQSSTIAYYADAAGNYGKLINLNFSASNGLSSSSLGTLISDLLVVRHDSSTDKVDVEFTYLNSSGVTSMVNIGLYNDNTKTPGPLTSLAPPTSLSLSNFNMGAQLDVYSYSGNSSQPWSGTINSLQMVPEPTTLAFLVLTCVCFAARKRWQRG